MPKQTVSNEAVVTAANAMAEAAETQQTVFVEHGLAPEFAATLREAAATLDQSLGARDTTRRRRVTAACTERSECDGGREGCVEARAAGRATAERDPGAEAVHRGSGG